MRARYIAGAVLCVGLAGCGGSKPGPNPNDKRAAALDCLTNEKHLPARSVGTDAIQVGRTGTGPRIRFYITIGEAEAAQLEGRAEGAEHIGTALLYVGAANDHLLKQVEACLDDLAS